MEGQGRGTSKKIGISLPSHINQSVVESCFVSHVLKLIVNEDMSMTGILLIHHVTGVATKNSWLPTGCPILAFNKLYKVLALRREMSKTKLCRSI